MNFIGVSYSLDVMVCERCTEMDERRAVKGFYEAARRTLFASRIAGYLPITGLLKDESKHSRCIWISMYTIYYVVSLLLMTSGALIHAYDALNTKRRFRDLGFMVQQCFAVATSLSLMLWSKNWEEIIKKIEDNERLLPPFKNPHFIFKKINRIMIFIMLLGLVEFTVHTIFGIRMILLCYVRDDIYIIETYYISYFRWFFDNVPFNYWTAFLIQSIKLQTTFIYNFVDGIVIMVTLYLVYRFRNFNRLMRIRQVECLKKKHTTWMDLQAHYTRLTHLVKIIDGYVNPFIFLSFLSNLVFICKRIYDIIQKQKKRSLNSYHPDCSIAHSSDWISVLHTAISTLHLFCRTIITSLITAHLHTLSREPLNALHTVPDSAYTPEMQRFMDQVYHSKISLSGLRIFYITRAIILSMISTIVTYELVLLQLPAIYT